MNKSANPSAVVIIIGNEILSGRTRDANLSYIGKRCDELGIRLQHARVIEDDEQTIIDTVNQCRRQYDYIFTTGGIGPTHDDITTLAIAKAFGVKLERNPEAVAVLDKYYAPGMLNEARLKMADIPAGAALIPNPVSGAPGIHIGNVFVLPGVPSIMQAMFEGIVDRLIGGDPMITASIRTNLAEGTFAADLTTLQQQFPDVSIGSYPFFRMGMPGVNLVLRSTDQDRVSSAQALVIAMIDKLGGKILNPEG
jgi:molybdenum cofactor synthesis domain-containing protein